MLPTRWARYEALPKNANGKIDRPRLKNAFFSAESHQAQLEAPSPDEAGRADRMLGAASGQS